MRHDNLKKPIIEWIKTQGSLNIYEDIFDKNYANLNKINSLTKNICVYDLGSSGATPKPFC